MPKTNDPKHTVAVAKMLPARGGIKVGKPGKVVTSAMKMRTASVWGAGGQTVLGMGGNFYSPELSTDFLELPQSLDEQRNYFRFFYKYEPFVGQAVDLHTELPLSKLRLAKPICRDKELGKKSHRFCEKWAKRIKLLHRLMAIGHDYNLLGEANIFCEDGNPEMPREIREECIREITAEGETVEKWVAFEDADAREVAWLKKNYKGWTAITVLPPEQIHMESFPFTSEKIVELIPDSKTKAIVEKADQGDPTALRIVNSMPPEVVASIKSGQNIPLNMDPDAGSYLYSLQRKRSDYEERGSSILQRCLLPGTMMTANRGNIIQQIPAEDVNEDTDLLLTCKGRFRPCKAGSRPIKEDVVHLHIEGLEEPLRLTADHEVLRVNDDGSEEWVEAGKLHEGDQVREAHVIPEKGQWKQTINLADWWKNRSVATVKRGRPNQNLPETERHLRVVQADIKPNPGLAVKFSYGNDNRNRQGALDGLEKILRWAQALEEPVEKSQIEVALEAGVSKRDVRVYVPRLRKEGLIHTEKVSLGRGKGTTTVWHPSRKGIPQTTAEASSPITHIEVTEDFCYLLGTWIGDGSVWTDDSLLNTHSVGWSLQSAVPEIALKVRQLIKKCFPNAHVEEGALIGKGFEDGADPIRIEDPLLGRWFMEEFGHKAQGKHLPAWFFDLPEDHIQAFLRGLLDTDGSLGVGRASVIEVTLDNHLLIDQLHLLCNRVGFKTQVKKVVKKAHSWERQWETKSGWKKKTYHYEPKVFWKLQCCNHTDVEQWAQGSVKGYRAEWPERSWTKKNQFVNEWLTRKITRIVRVPYEGPVFSFDVEEDISHVTSHIVTHNCMRTLVFRDKVRQSLTSISSRHMTPYRLVYAEDMNEEQTEELREQVDMALQDPDYSIITNFQVNWEEMGADQRLPDWSWVWDFTDRQMYAGLGVTESLLSGESSYSGDRIHLEVINTRYMLTRELFQDLVEDGFFKPMCRRMGFVEEDEDGNLEVIYPRLSFTRLALRDNSDTFDALFNLYQKGSLDIDTIYDLLNLDPDTIQEKLRRDLFTLNDATFNEVLRGIYSQVGTALAENSDVTDKIAKNLGLNYEKPKEEGGRF